MTRTRTFKSWEGMKQRCLNPRAPDYARYGGRGIRVNEAWAESFETFLRDMGERPVGLTLDRMDVNGNYEPGNCRWATLSRQQRNRRDTVSLTFAGQTLSVADWADDLGIKPKLIRERLKNGWPLERALYGPARRLNQNDSASRQIMM